MKQNRMLRVLCAMMALVILLGVPTMGMAAETAAVAKAAKPTSVELDVTAKTMLPGLKLQLTATVEPADASQSVTWKSNKTSVATVNSKGVVTTKAAGTAKITATTKTGSKKATCVITVSKQFEGVNVHFYGIGNANYTASSVTNLAACYYDLANMKKIYGAATFGGKSADTSHSYNNRTGEGIVDVLKEMVSDTTITEDDITIFYYTGHGAGLDWPAAYHGALCGTDISTSSADQYKGLVTVDTVQGYLDQVKGNVVVIIDSCYSGQFITFKGKDSGEGSTAAATAVNNAWVSALSKSRATNFTGKALTGSAVKNKYFILTAASNSQVSSAFTTTSSWSLFTQALYEYYGKTTRNQVKSLDTVYKAVNKTVNSFKATWNKRYPKNKVVQVTKVWPSSSKFPIFAWN